MAGTAKRYRLSQYEKNQTREALERCPSPGTVDWGASTPDRERERLMLEFGGEHERHEVRMAMEHAARAAKGGSDESRDKR